MLNDTYTTLESNNINKKHNFSISEQQQQQPSQQQPSQQQQEHHVHFDENCLKDDYELDSSVTYQKAGDNVIAIHLGFLQINHRYLIELRLPGNLFKCGNIETVKLIPDDSSVPSVHCRLIDIVNEKSIPAASDASTTTTTITSGTLKNDTNNATAIDYHDVKVEYFAHREKLLREELKLINANNKEELLKLVITARVLGKGKGTPMLRNGIHCIGVEVDEESEQSDASSSFARVY